MLLTTYIYSIFFLNLYTYVRSNYSTNFNFDIWI